MLAREFYEAVSRASSLSVDQVRECIAAMGDVCAAELTARGKTRIPKFVDIKVSSVSERVVRNPKTGLEWLEGPSTRVCSKPVPIFARRIKSASIS